MITFLFIVALVLLVVDLIVRFIVDPLLISSREKNKDEKSLKTKFDPSVVLATETMFDGGKPQNEDKNTNKTDTVK